MKNVIDFIENNKYTIIGHLVFMSLLLLAIIYAKERVFITDPACQLAYMINTEECFISYGRYSMAIAHLIPLLLIWTKCPLYMVIAGYSVSFILLGYAIFIIAVHFLKNNVAGILIASAVLLEYHIFFHAVAETVQMIYFCTLLIAWLKYSPQASKYANILYYIGLIAIVFLCVNIHPSAIFPIAFIICYNFIDRGLKINRKLIVSSIAFFIFEILKSFTFTDKYETKFFDFDSIITSVSNFFNIDIFQKFIEYTFFQIPLLYFVPMLLFILCVIFYAKEKQWIKLCFIICFNIAFMFVNVLIYSTDGYCFGTFERMFMPLIIFTMLPFANDVLPCLTRRQENMVAGIWSLFIVFSFVGINHVSEVYTKRLQEVEKVIKVANAENKHKLFIKNTRPANKLLSAWGTHDICFVSTLQSALVGPDKTITLYMEPCYDYKQDCIIDVSDLIITLDKKKLFYKNKLNPNYFIIPEVPYCEIKYKNGEYFIEDDSLHNNFNNLK
jgi:hypothetical protein